MRSPSFPTHEKQPGRERRPRSSSSTRAASRRQSRPRLQRSSSRHAHSRRSASHLRASSFPALQRTPFSDMDSPHPPAASRHTRHDESGKGDGYGEVQGSGAWEARRRQGGAGMWSAEMEENQRLERVLRHNLTLLIASSSFVAPNPNTSLSLPIPLQPRPRSPSPRPAFLPRTMSPPVAPPVAPHASPPNRRDADDKAAVASHAPSSVVAGAVRPAALVSSVSRPAARVDSGVHELLAASGPPHPKTSASTPSSSQALEQPQAHPAAASSSPPLPASASSAALAAQLDRGLAVPAPPGVGKATAEAAVQWSPPGSPAMHATPLPRSRAPSPIAAVPASQAHTWSYEMSMAGGAAAAVEVAPLMARAGAASVAPAAVESTPAMAGKHHMIVAHGADVGDGEAWHEELDPTPVQRAINRVVFVASFSLSVAALILTVVLAGLYFP